MKNSPIHKPAPQPFLIWLAAMTVITAAFFGARSCYWSEPAVDEDGIFAKIVMDHTKGPTYIFLARISHKEYYIYIAHPGIIYEVLKTPGFILNMNRHKGDAIGQRTVVSMRIAMSMFQYTVMLLLLLAVIPRREDPGPRGWLPFCACAGVILAWSLAPPSIISSLDLQIDGSVGVLMVGALGVAVLFDSRRPVFRSRWCLVFLTAGFCGCGKTTWTLSVIAALGLSGLCLLALSCTPRKNPGVLPRAKAIYGMIAAGTFVGNVISYRFDPENYRRALDRLVGFAGSQTGTAVENVMQKLPTIWPLLALLIMAAVMLAYDLSRKGPMATEHSLFLFFLGFFLTAHLIFGSWYFPRYFAPASIAALIAVVSLLSRRISRSVLCATAALSAVGGILALQFIHERATAVRNGLIAQKTVAITEDNLRRIDYSKSHGCTPLLGVAYAVEHVNEDFVANSGGLEGARDFLTPLGGTPCDPSILYR